MMNTAIEAAMEKAGIATGGKRLDAEISRVLAKTRGDVNKAASALWMILQKDKDLARAAMAQLIQESKIRNGISEKYEIQPEELAIVTFSGVGGNAPPNKERLRAMEKSRNSSANTIFDRTFLHSGRPLGNVHYNEFSSLIEDGEVIKAVREHIGYVPVDKRGTIREMMTATELHLVLKKIQAKVN